MTRARRVVPAFAAAGTLLALGCPGPVAADSVEETIAELKAEIERLQERVAQLERELRNGPVEPRPEVAAPQSDPAPRVAIGGRVKLDLVHNSASAGGPGGTNRADLALSPGAVPVDDRGEEDQTTFSARQSRLWATARLPSPYGELSGYVEGDFFSTESSGNERVSNGYTPRLRHAYAQFAGFTFGQTWTTFMNVAAYPEHNDDNGPAGIVNVRQPLVRWTAERPWGAWHLAVEEPEATLTAPDGTRSSPDDDRWPDLVTRVDFRGPWGQWSIAGMLRELRADGASGDADDAAWGGALSAAGRIYITGRNNLRFMVNAGNALGRYLAFNTFNGGSIDSAGAIDLQTSTGGFLAYQHWWTSSLRSNLSIGYARTSNDLERVPESVDEWVASAHANLLWSPVRALTVGAEWIHAYRALESGADGELDRFQFTGIYRF